jgi:hypothetical protein
MNAQVLKLERFVDLFAATEYAMQNGGDVWLSENGAWWYVKPEAPSHYGFPGHCPFAPEPDCPECRALGWLAAPVVEVEGAAAR